MYTAKTIEFVVSYTENDIALVLVPTLLPSTWDPLELENETKQIENETKYRH
jgi:hypothetical protein